MPTSKSLFRVEVSSDRAARRSGDVHATAMRLPLRDIAWQPTHGHEARAGP